MKKIKVKCSHDFRAKFKKVNGIVKVDGNKCIHCGEENKNKKVTY